MNDLIFSALVDAAENYHSHLGNKVEFLRQQEADLIASAIKEKVALPNDYWKDRHHAERLLAASEALTDTLGRIQHEVDSYRHNAIMQRSADNGGAERGS